MILTNDFSLLKKNQVKKNLFYGSQVRKQGLTNNDALLMRAHSDRQATPGVISFTIRKHWKQWKATLIRFKTNGRMLSNDG